jgi:hypothetical protein
METVAPLGSGWMKAPPSMTARISRPATIAVRMLVPVVLGLQPVGEKQRKAANKRAAMGRRILFMG